MTSDRAYPQASKGQIKRFAKLHQKKHRDSEGLFLAEGLRTVNELLLHLPSDDTLVALLVEPRMLPQLRLAGRFRERVFLLDQASSERISATSSAQGVTGIFRQQKNAPIPDFFPAGDGRSLVIALDDVQDPGNVGTIARTAAWFGVSAMISGPGTADGYNPKAIRASAGSVFCLSRYTAANLRESLGSLRDSGYEIICSSLQGADVRSFKGWPEKSVLVIGNEAQGIQQQVLDMADRLVAIPHAGADPGVESLNAAVSAAILVSLLSL